MLHQRVGALGRVGALAAVDADIKQRLGGGAGAAKAAVSGDVANSGRPSGCQPEWQGRAVVAEAAAAAGGAGRADGGGGWAGAR